ncbi:MAG: hypothetical protein KZQ66_07145 [Candidatus Thiodiazotropha sp. (ex Lucinoma aequizonata)]|nr:hypothetical protein [Candidatus Thiodiazotropha sp. (ex Lucinoma aequizonata)]MCU7894681.1 hypothetical protein [Candidatus Thiodiazotropha sp. (ex Lucinoma aequizonata)]MCU7901788.1 hypothetical protein [Candidatus Thiodiazotropha sp. (ex Lucinoma aequizonata)]
MFLVTQTKNGISALELMRHLGVSYGTAWSIKHKLMQVMKGREDGQLLDGIIQMDDAYWGGRTPWWKAWSRCTSEGAFCCSGRHK